VDFRRIFTAIRRKWWILAITVTVGISAGILATTLVSPEYTATATLFVSATGGTSSSEAYSGGQFSEQRAASYVRIITSEPIIQRVINQLSLPMSAGELSSEVTAANVPRTVLLDISVTDRSPDRAADIANTLSDVFIAYAGPLETPVGQNTPRSQITTFSRAEVPSSPSSPNIRKNVLYGVAGGIGVGLAGIALAALVSRRIRSADELGRITSKPVFGPNNTPDRDVDARMAHLTHWGRREAEGFRRLRAQIEAHDPAPQVVLVMPASPGNPATTFGVGLASAFCEAGCTTTLVAADPELGSLSSGLGSGDETAGLAELLEGKSSFGAVFRLTPAANLFLVPPGHAADIESLLSSPSMSRFVDDLRNKFDRVVILTASASDSSAASVLSAIADGVFLVVDTKKSRRRHVERAMSELDAARAPMLGAVLVES
jgi:succinoglycan biosynthesis transport protein ExoP